MRRSAIVPVWQGASATELKFTRKKTRRPKPRARGPSVRVRAALRPTMPANHDKQRHGFAVVFSPGGDPCTGPTGTYVREGVADLEAHAAEDFYD